MGGRGEGEPGAVLAQDEFLGLGKGVVLAAQGILGEAGAVGFVCGQRGHVVDAIGEGRRSFVRGVVADQIRATAGDRGALGAGVVAEGVRLGRVDLVADDAGEHGGSFRCWHGDSGLRGLNASATVEV